MEQLKITKDWLIEKGFKYWEEDNSCRLPVDEFTQVRYYFKDSFFVVDKWDETNKGHMSYFNKCLSTEKVIQILEAFDIKFK